MELYLHEHKQKWENLHKVFPGCDNIFHNTSDNSRTSSQISTTKTQPQQTTKKLLIWRVGYHYKTQETSTAPLAHSNLFLSNCHTLGLNKCRVSQIISFMSCKIDYTHMIIKIYNKIINIRHLKLPICHTCCSCSAEGTAGLQVVVPSLPSIRQIPKDSKEILMASDFSYSLFFLNAVLSLIFFKTWSSVNLARFKAFSLSSLKTCKIKQKIV